jgi:hypothetical protein
MVAYNSILESCIVTSYNVIIIPFDCCDICYQTELWRAKPEELADPQACYTT